MVLFISGRLGGTFEASQSLGLHANGGEGAHGSLVRIVETPGVSSFALQHAIRVGDIPTAALAKPLPSCKFKSHWQHPSTSQRDLHRCFGWQYSLLLVCS